jgi:hypothetical protein
VDLNVFLFITQSRGFCFFHASSSRCLDASAAACAQEWNHDLVQEDADVRSNDKLCLLAIIVLFELLLLLT